ncbi:glycoprotein 3-alpha-L-fucosyltransferase A-like [Palaemon carinicauda]|uniref:glycoprotein 3-alpha-L-fucosyltransferase A-like n=1 Tax=Palaemon carinicauda TaxID=392227 RepID=UPI0035B60667
MTSRSLDSGLSQMTHLPSTPRWKHVQRRHALFTVFSICIIFLYFQNDTLRLTVPFNLSIYEGETTNPNVNSTRKVDGTTEAKRTSSGYKTIVIYTKFFSGSWSKYLRYGRIDLANHGCPVHQCRFSFDKDKASSADAVVFHGVDFNPNDVPKIRHRHQRYIWLIVEAPSLYKNMTAVKPPKTPGIFNWTATYNRKSDILISYGALLPKKGGPLPDTLYPLDLKSLTYKNYTEALAQKMKLIREANGTLGLEDLLAKLRGGRKEISANITRKSEGIHWANSTEVEELSELYLNSSFYSRPKLVAWMVSHCYTLSGREVYISELKKYIPVDIYGGCGSLKCGTNHMDLYCYVDLLQPNYKFYLAFENNCCVDYITEKYVLVFSTMLLHDAAFLLYVFITNYDDDFES